MEILTDDSTTGLTQAAEANLTEKSLVYCSLPGTRQGGPNPRWFITGSGLAGYNGVVHACFERNEVDEGIERTLRPFRERNLPLTWWTGPSSGPSNLGARLQMYGFIHNRDMIGMSAVIDKLAPPVDMDMPSLPIEEVTGPEMMNDWLPLYLEGFNSPSSSANESKRMMSSVSFKPDSLWHHYLVRQDQQVIAIASTFYGGGVAGLYNLVTAPSQRGKGIGAALTLKVFQIARDAGYRIATLQTTYPNALRLYHRLGFEVYCKFGIYQKLRHP